MTIQLTWDYTAKLFRAEGGGRVTYGPTPSQALEEFAIDLQTADLDIVCDDSEAEDIDPDDA